MHEQPLAAPLTGLVHAAPPCAAGAALTWEELQEQLQQLEDRFRAMERALEASGTSWWWGLLPIAGWAVLNGGMRALPPSRCAGRAWAARGAGALPGPGAQARHLGPLPLRASPALGSAAGRQGPQQVGCSCRALRWPRRLARLTMHAHHGSPAHATPVQGARADCGGERAGEDAHGGAHPPLLPAARRAHCASGVLPVSNTACAASPWRRRRPGVAPELACTLRLQPG